MVYYKILNIVHCAIQETLYFAAFKKYTSIIIMIKDIMKYAYSRITYIWKTKA